ncbi:MAG: FkbM family methyltransferase [Fibrobacteria bacterium]|nr:FkbM family methyltransferase [Fibrobacteria bacterium]
MHTNVGWLVLDYLQDNVQATMAYDGMCGEQKNVAFAKTLPFKGGEIVFDLGAHVGFYSMLFARLVGPTGQVVAFEPDPYSLEAIKQSALLNGYDHITCEQYAVSNCTKEDFFFLSEHSAMGSFLDRNEFETKKTSIQCITLDDYIKNKKFSNIDLLKIDIEGAEHFVLTQARQLLDKYRPDLFIEVHSPLIEALGGTCEDMLALIAGYKYNMYYLDNGRPIKFSDSVPQYGNWHLYASMKELHS